MTTRASWADLAQVAIVALPELFNRAEPKHSHRARFAIHPLGHFFEGESLKVAEDDHFAVIRPKLCELIGHLHSPLASMRRGAR